ncbi:hypothetical protein FGADI_2387 [Fusarium gaditjirri]|uniref:Protein kinase domain-containing protein n=1 Tax=Fusarium gaditjirri TaxID=282569 RepID=A0A8H4TI75_9HYPO|nr:hypothetical protein FGADI_2387 [Fusarium gaditjirri]
MDTHVEGPPSYEVGDVLQLHIIHSDTDVLTRFDRVSVTISEVITCTMATVVRINFNGGSAVLKLYDRRFGNSLRDCDYQNIPYSDEAKAAYHEFLQRGAMGPFLNELDDEESAADVIPRTMSDIRNGPDGVARFEAALWRLAHKHYRTESEAYARMQDLQGVLIPKLYAVVRLVTPGETTRVAEYLNIPGILLESIEGYSLDDLVTAPGAPATEQEWSSIVQRAIDSTHEINKRGIILDDSAPRNVVVDQTTKQVFIIDFAQCLFKDTMFDAWFWDTDAKD